MRAFLESLGFEKVRLAYGWDDEEIWAFRHPGFDVGHEHYLSDDFLSAFRARRDYLPLVLASEDTRPLVRFLATLMLERG